MTFLDNLRAHKGGLIRLKTELDWYGQGYDNNPGRVCLVLDAAAAEATAPAAAAGAGAAATAAEATAVALLLIDGSPQWVWVAEEDVEVLDDPP